MCEIVHYFLLPTLVGWTDIRRIVSRKKELGLVGALLPDLESLYKDIHSHPELSMQENRTAGFAAEHLRAAGYDVATGIGKTGVVGVLKNGDGPTIMLRADMDALPVREATGLPYASDVTVADSEGKTVPVMHACGHDMHVTWLIGAATLFAQHRDLWRGTLMPLFQPAEETGEGARAMIDDGLFKRVPKPDVILGQHVMVGSSGVISSRSGVITSAGDSLQIRRSCCYGGRDRASFANDRLSGSAPTDAAVVTVGSLQAGTKENVILMRQSLS
jgi:hippurate hydrolase